MRYARENSIPVSLAGSIPMQSDPVRSRNSRVHSTAEAGLASLELRTEAFVFAGFYSCEVLVLLTHLLTCLFAVAVRFLPLPSE